MVKPSKRMQPEAVDLEEINRNGTRGMRDDDFGNYMAGKIHKQREQIGLRLPPPPPQPANNDGEKPPAKRVRFAKDVPLPAESDKNKKRIRKVAVHYANPIIKRLQKRQSRRKRSRSNKRERNENSSDRAESQPVNTSSTREEEPLEESQAAEQIQISTAMPTSSPASLKRHRPDLFFHGVVVQINGYTNPDTDTLTRMLQQHGGDREAYETTRVTHIIAESLSTAKANIYKKQRDPTPVCRPSWIVDSVREKRLLPYGDYLIDEVKPEATNNIKAFFGEKRESTIQSCQQPKSVLKGGSSSLMQPLHSAEIDELTGTQTSTLTEISAEKAAEKADRGNMLPVDRDDATAHVENNSTKPTLKSSSSAGVGETHHRNGEPRTVGNDPLFLERFFSNSRLSFIGSFKQRARQSPKKKSAAGHSLSSHRYVFHVDMDCFFAAVVLRNRPECRGLPVVISHHGRGGSAPASANQGGKGSTSECSTCNYEARKKGIKKGMYLGRAKELCPELVVLDYDFEGYEEVAGQVADILFQVASAHDGSAVQASCDEAYLELYLSDDLLGSRSHIEVAHDIAESIRREIFTMTDCTASVGVGTNKLMAKLATDKVKPDGCFVVTDCRDLLEPLKLRDLPGVGYKKERELSVAGFVSVRDVWELGNQAESELMHILGPSLGKKIVQYCNGEDDRPVETVERKTVGAECNYGVRFNGPYGPHDMIEGLAKEVEKRMEGLQVRGKQVILKVKVRKPHAPPPPKFLGHGSCFNLSRSARTSGNTATRSWETISGIGISLLKDLNVDKGEIRGMGITLKELIGERNAGAASRSITHWYTEADPKHLPRGTVEDPKGQDCVVLADDRRAVDGTCLDGIGSHKSRKVDMQISGDEESIGGGGHEEDEDFEIPSCSQIALSQIGALPDYMQKKIKSKIENETMLLLDEDPGEQISPFDELRQKPARSLNIESPGKLLTHMKQPRIDHMFKLEAVKSGHEDLSETLGGRVSLTQLDALPRPMQLQVVSNGETPFANVSTRSSARSPPSGVRMMSRGASLIHNEIPSDGGHGQQNHNALQDYFEIEDDEDDRSRQAELLHGDQSENFYRNNIVPLREFMNENQDAPDDAIRVVRELLLEVFTSRLRFPDAIKLLRHIKRREDLWASKAYPLLLNAVDKDSVDRLGGPLDKAWAGL